MILSLLFFIHSISASFLTGGVMPDGKVDKVVEAPGQWHGPLYGADVRVAFAPDWYALHEWNDATVGSGLSYTPAASGTFRVGFAPGYRCGIHDQDLSQYSARGAYVCGCSGG